MFTFYLSLTVLRDSFVGNIRNLRDRFIAVDFEATVQFCIDQTKDAIITYNRDYMYRGLLVDGNPISPDYKSDEYENFKQAIHPNKPKMVPDLYVTGAFYRGLAVVVNKKSFITSSTDEKAAKLELQYTNKIYGLSNEDIPKYVAVLAPVLLTNLKKQTVGG